MGVSLSVAWHAWGVGDPLVSIAVSISSNLIDFLEVADALDS